MTDAQQQRRGIMWVRVAGRCLTAGYLLAAVALLVWAGTRRFRLPQEPLIDPDIEGYLGPAVASLSGKPFGELIGRSFPYPGFVYLILRLFGDFRAIAVIQHFLGLAAGGLVMLAWNAAGALVPEGGIPRPLFRWLGLVPAYLFLFSATTILYEHQIRPEAIFSFLAILDIWLGFRFLDARFVSKKPVYIWWGAAICFVSCLLNMAKPSFGFATVFATLPVWISLFLPSTPAPERARFAAAAILPSLLLLIVPGQILESRDPWAPLFLPETLFTVHARIIEQQMADDLAGRAPLPQPQALVRIAHDLLGSELEKAAAVTTKTYPSLGFNPDYLMYEDSFCTKFAKLEHYSAREMARFCMTWYRQALLHHPGLMVAKARRELALFYCWKNPAYWLGRNMEISSSHYARVAEIMPLTSALGPGNPLVERYIAACEKLAAENISIVQDRRFGIWLRVFASHYLDLLAVAALSPALLLVRPLRFHFQWLIAALWLAYSYNFGNSLTIAVVHSLEVNRYVRIQLIFTIFSQCLTIYLLLELAIFEIRRRLAPK